MSQNVFCWVYVIQCLLHYFPEVISEVETQGKITPMTNDKAKKLMETPLKCHKCSFLAKNMPTLKSHILVHLKKLPGV
jgi:aprataxin